MFFYTVRRYKRLFSDLHLRLLVDEWRVFNCYKLLLRLCENYQHSVGMTLSSLHKLDSFLFLQRLKSILIPSIFPTTVLRTFLLV